jgi:hypothetical protein
MANNTANSNTCTCKTCVGAQCTCGCQKSVANRRPGCGCGDACTCGAECSCN